MNDPLVRGSIVLVVAFGIFNVLNFAFHIVMARSLETADYGVLATLFSIMYIMGFFTESIQTVIAKYSTAQKSDGKVASLLRRSLHRVGKPALILFGCYLLSAFALSPLLEISWFLIAVNGLMIFCAFYLPVTRGVLQGKQRFGALGLNMIVEGAVKIVIASALVLVGWRVYGALVGTILGAVGAYIMSLVSLSKIRNTREEHADASNIYAYGKPTFILIMGLMIFYSLDVILAKLFFDSTTAGMYAIASVLAKTIFLGTQPISKAMFPLAAENDASAEKSKKKILLKALYIIVLLIATALALFYLAPHFIIDIFSGKDIVDAAKILLPLGAGFSLVSISNLMILYHLSRKSVRYSWLIFIPVAVQAILLWMFSSNLMQFSIALLCASVTLLGVTLIMVVIGRRKEA